MSTYRKGAMIGRGSLGTVMRLHNDPTKEDVVMKHVKQIGTNSSSSLDNTLHRLVSLRSETLLPYLSYDRHGDGFDVFMSFWDKKTLGKHVERQQKNGVKLTEGQIYGFLSQIVPGLLFLHEHGIVHGLLKPSNVLVVSQTRCLLCDYGLAEFIPRSKLVQSPFTAPELRHGAPLSPQTDVFSLGVLLYFLCTWAFPYNMKTLEKASKGMDSEKGLSEMWNTMRWIGNTYSQGLWKTVKTMLHPDSSQRPSLNSLPLLSRINTATKGALDRSLMRHLSHSPLSTPQTTDRAPILVDSETKDDDALKKDDDDEDRDFDPNEALRSVADPVPTFPELILRNKPPSFSSEPAVDFFTPKTKASRRSQHRVGEGEAEERGRSGRMDERNVWDGPDSFPAAQPSSPPISASSARLASFHALPHPSDVFGRQGRVASGMGGGRGRAESGEGERREKEGWADSPGLSQAMRMEVMEMIAVSVGEQGKRGREAEGEREEKEGWRRKESAKRRKGGGGRRARREGRVEEEGEREEKEGWRRKESAKRRKGGGGRRARREGRVEEEGEREEKEGWRRKESAKRRKGGGGRRARREGRVEEEGEREEKEGWRRKESAKRRKGGGGRRARREGRVEEEGEREEKEGWRRKESAKRRKGGGGRRAKRRKGGRRRKESAKRRKGGGGRRARREGRVEEEGEREEKEGWRRKESAKRRKGGGGRRARREGRVEEEGEREEKEGWRRKESAKRRKGGGGRRARREGRVEEEGEREEKEGWRRKESAKRRKGGGGRRARREGRVEEEGEGHEKGRARKGEPASDERQ
ncbi:putative Protein kinase domain containing protein [Blattamonas nauphoetae]|uniref:Protein kinase domain-containing protein n=1 Tax=Blattamonas nauphoetae TaxID=2049346 RepID=A0ABQ9XRV8_9EUKA|nr:putative Protein kinase domain containing protein [Blattamonas nauphoetae]